MKNKCLDTKMIPPCQKLEELRSVVRMPSKLTQIVLAWLKNLNKCFFINRASFAPRSINQMQSREEVLSTMSLLVPKTVMWSPIIILNKKIVASVNTYKRLALLTKLSWHKLTPIIQEPGRGIKSPLNSVHKRGEIKTIGLVVSHGEAKISEGHFPNNATTEMSQSGNLTGIYIN